MVQLNSRPGAEAGDNRHPGRRILVIEARFYENIADELYAGAVAEIEAQGASHDRVVVPGALEIPQAMIAAVAAGRFEDDADSYHGVVALGCVIRGETSHYDTVCNESARGLMALSIERKLPLANGILTCENKAQAVERADPSKKNKGASFAQAALTMFALKGAMA